MNAKPLLEMRGVGKAFPGVRALDSVDFTVRPGEVHALMGENGAGKSTLIKVLTGVYPKDSGATLFDGREIFPASPLEAERAGIATVYQEVNLIPDLSVAENIMLGRQPRRAGIIRWGALNARAAAALERLGLRIDVSKPVSEFSMAIQQMIAIARALDVDAKLLVLDEPTSSLDEQEVSELFAVMRRLRDAGLGLIFVTHFLDQVYAIADRITVLRNGALVGEFEAAELPRLELIGKMLGREPGKARAAASTPSRSGEEEAGGGARTDTLLEAKGIGRKGSVGPLDFSIGKGEVLGLAGLLGSGRTETARLVFGADRLSCGSISMDGEDLGASAPAAAIARGIAFCSEDRKSEGIVPSLSVRENMILAMQAKQGALRRLPRGRQLEIANHYIDALQIKTPTPETPIENLSGGNQQKVLLARWLCMQPRLLILDEPTRGIDIGAKAEIEKLVESLRRDGMSILFISSELEETVRACTRVVVMRDRQKAGELQGKAIEENRIMKMIAAVEK